MPLKTIELAYGTFKDGKWTCSCGNEPRRWQSKQPNSYGRWFWRCDRDRNRPQCKFYLWEDDKNEYERGAIEPQPAPQTPKSKEPERYLPTPITESTQAHHPVGGSMGHVLPLSRMSLGENTPGSRIDPPQPPFLQSPREALTPSTVSTPDHLTAGGAKTRVGTPSDTLSRGSSPSNTNIYYEDLSRPSLFPLTQESPTPARFVNVKPEPREDDREETVSELPASTDDSLEAKIVELLASNNIHLEGPTKRALHNIIEREISTYEKRYNALKERSRGFTLKFRMPSFGRRVSETV